MTTIAIRLAGLVLAGLLPGACGHDCNGIASCALQPAIRVSVTSALGPGPVANVALDVSGANVGPTACTMEASATVCTVVGYPGTYGLVVRAPGFESVERSVPVRGSSGQCGCPLVTLENVRVALLPTP
jgi:hypothetical protein